MSLFRPILRSCALVAATLVLNPSSAVTTAATLAGVTAATVMTTSQAEAGRQRVQDHRTRKPPCPPHAGGPGCTRR
jgi:hypothetical protein